MSSKHAAKNVTKIAPKSSKATGYSDTMSTGSPAAPFFPFARYTSIVGVHTSLLAFTALFLPRTTLSMLWEPSTVSADITSDTIATKLSRLPSLTENPLRTAAWLCAGTFILQLWWASWIRGWSLETRELSRGGKVHDLSSDRTEQKLQRQSWNKGRLAAFLTACLSTAAGSFVFAILALLFGAPVYSHYLHTFLLGVLVSSLTIYTPAYTFGAPSLKSDVVAYVTRLTWIRLFAELSPRDPVERAVVYPAVGAILGCWSGAIPAGLDWEEPWQRWPLTTSYGALAGFILGSLWALGVSATENLANLDRQSQQHSAPKEMQQPQGKQLKRVKVQ